MPNNNITFGVNLLPSPTGTYALGSTTQKWKLYAEEINGSTPELTDTKNTAGAINSLAKLYLIGAPTQTAEPQTYSHEEVYMQNGILYSNDQAVLTSAVTSIQVIAGTGIAVDRGTAVMDTGSYTVSINGIDATNGSEEVFLSQQGTWVEIPKATSTNLGAVKIGFTPGQNQDDYYAVQLTNDGKMYVNVPSTDEKMIQTVSSTNNEFKILASDSASPSSGDAAEAIYASNITLNPSTSTITATNFNGTAAYATQLTDARTIQTDLSLSTAASFDGTANITPGVTGILPITHGGIGRDSAPLIQVNLSSEQSPTLLPSDSNVNPGVYGTLPVTHGGTGVATFTADSVIMSGSVAQGADPGTVTSTAPLTTRTLVHNNSSAAALSATSDSIPTIATVAHGLATVNGAAQSSTVSIYAPTTAGTATYILQANAQGIPNWTAILPVANGGTGSGSFTTNAILYAAQSNGATTIESTIAPANAVTHGQVLVTGTSNSSPSWVTPQIIIGSQTKGIGTISEDNEFNTSQMVMDLGLANIFHYKGMINTIPSSTDTFAHGDVYAVNIEGDTQNSGIYIYSSYINDGAGGWQKIATGAGYKIMQQALASPSVLNSTMDSEFINSIKQDTNGVISTTKAYLPATHACSTVTLKVGNYSNVSSTITDFYSNATDFDIHMIVQSGYANLRAPVTATTTYDSTNHILTCSFTTATEPAGDVVIKYFIDSIYKGQSSAASS